MKYTLHIVPTAERQFLKFQSSLQSRVKSKLLFLENEPRPYGSQKLHGTNFFRIRIGDYRVIYSIDDTHKMVKILDMGHRREVYRGWGKIPRH